MFRRTFLQMVAALPMTVVAELPASASLIDIPAEPGARLVRLKWLWLHNFKHEWHIRDEHNWSYVGEGWGKREFPSKEIRTYVHYEIKGDGATIVEAIDDWYKELPKQRADAVFWRVEPEMESWLDFDTKQMRHRVYSRFAVIPFGEL